MRRVFLIVLDGLGIGAAPDAAAYGDEGSNTLGNVARASGGVDLPVLEGLGLGKCRPILGMADVDAPEAAHGVALPSSRGKDSTSGHWELCGVVLDEPFPTYAEGFPEGVVVEFAQCTGRGVLGNRAASGTTIINELGPEHERTGAWIVYTSADSVFQVAAHEETVPVDELYRACEAARAMLVGEHRVARVIARPFVGARGEYRRTDRRRDFSVEPVGPTLLDRLADAGVPRLGIGKVDDLFAGRGIASTHTPTNRDAYRLLGEALADVAEGLVFANVIEFDQAWGHRNDVQGFKTGLEELDAALPSLLGALDLDDLFILTADHGNDPTTPSTDHSREAVPILVCGPRVKPANLGERQTFADVGQTVAEYLGVEPLEAGRSFLSMVIDD